SYHVNSATWVEFLAILFGWRLPRWVRVYQAAHIALALLTVAAPRAAVGRFAPANTLTLLPTLLLILVSVPWMAWRGDREARTICFGVLVFALARVYLVSAPFLSLPRFDVTSIGILALILATAVSLSNRFVRVYA